ncbi:unnamed protein product [[Candida] boidinii]|uniref:Unnamed protein product n=1 Tax=Candida boidinii TaxID=5477 RepID=A0A9W6T347_CANBO|nr:unnamed protein product [[Candida] boidinii]
MSVPNSSNNNSNNNNNSATIINNNNSNSNTNTTPTLNFASLSTSTITSPSSNTPFGVPQSSSSNTGNFNYGGDIDENQNHSNTNSARKSLSSANVPLNLQHSRSRTYQSQHSSIFYNYQSSASPSNRRNKRSNSLTNSQGEILNQNSLVYQNLSVSGVNQNSYGNNVSSLQMHQQQQEDQQQQQQQEDQQHAQLYQSSYTNSHSHLHPHSYSHSHSQSQSHPHSHSYSHSYSHSHSLYHTNNHSHSSIANSNGSGYHSNQISSSININNNISGNVSNDNANQGAINSNGNSEEESSLEEITRWKNLKYLSLTENDIVNISQWSFDSMQNLSSLDLSYNKITKIPTKPLSKLINLKSLNLSYNKFTSMKGMPRTLRKLSVLNIKGNQIDCLDDLEYLISLKKIDLRQNKISKMSQLIPLFLMKDEDNTLSLTGLYIAGNAITGNRGYRIELFNLFNGVDYLNNLRIDGSRPGIFESRLLLDFRNARLKLKQFLDETIIIQMAESVSSMNLNKMLQNPKETTINDSDKSKGFNGSSLDNNTFVSNKILPNNQRIKSSSNPAPLIPESKTSIAAAGAHSRSVSVTSATTSTTTMTSTTTTTTTRTTSAPNQDISSLRPGNSSSKTYSTPILSYNTTTVVSSTIEPRRLTGISETETETESEIQKSNANPHTNSTTSLNSIGKERNNDDTSLMPPPKLYSLGSYNNNNNNSASNDNNTNSNTNKVSSTSNSPLIDRNISFPATSPFATGSGSYFTSKMTPVSTSDIASGLGINGGNSNSTPTIPQSPASTLVSASNYISASGVGANIGNREVGANIGNREVGSANLDDHELFNVHSSGSSGNNNNNPLNPNRVISRRPSGHSSILSSFIEQTSQLSSLQNHPKGGNSGEGISTPSSTSHADLLNNDRSNILKAAPNLPGEIIHSPSVSVYHSPVNLFSSPVSSMSNSTANNTSNPISRISIAAPALPIVTAATTTITSGYPAPKQQDKNEDLEISEPKSNEEPKMPTSIKAIQMTRYFT